MNIKAFFISIAAIASCTSAMAQYQKGDKLIGGIISFSTDNTTIDTRNNLNSIANTSTTLKPRFSWVTGKHIMQGVFVTGSYSRNSLNYTQSSSVNQNLTGGGGYFIRNFRGFTNQFGWYIDYSVGGELTNNEGTFSSGRTSETYASANIAVVPGIYYCITPNFALEATFGGLSARYYKTINNPFNSHGFNIGLNYPNFSFGVQVLLGKRTMMAANDSTN